MSKIIGEALVGQAQAGGGVAAPALREPGRVESGDRATGGGAVGLAGWRVEFLEGGVAALKRCADDSRVSAPTASFGDA
ncbi:MAG: hypothetical protein Kow0020_05570 [Wenzhouxiangellaceae bacterium]